MKKDVTIGLLGTGEIGRLHARAHAGTEGTRLCIAGLIQPEQERELSARHGAELYASLEALLDNPGVDAVDICLPNDLHRPYAVRALEAGKHVFCEKPMALTLEDADAMIDAARRAGRFLMIGHVLRFWPEYRKIKEVLDARALGAPLLATARRNVSLLVGTRGDQGWRHDPQRSGGAVLDLQVHDLDVFCWFFGRPRSLIARGIRSPDGALSHVFTHLEFPGAQQALVEASFMMRGNPIDIFVRVLGSERSLEYTFQPEHFALHELASHGKPGKRPSLILYEWQKEPQPLYVPQADSFEVALRDELRYFADCVRTGNSPSVGSAEQARLALEIALVSQESCETGEAVSW